MKRRGRLSQLCSLAAAATYGALVGVGVMAVRLEMERSGKTLRELIPELYMGDLNLFDEMEWKLSDLGSIVFKLHEAEHDDNQELH